MLKKIVSIGLVLLVVVILAGLYAYFKKSTDYAKQKPDVTIQLNALLAQLDSDTSAVNKMRNQLVLIQNAEVKAIQTDSIMSVIELSTPSSTSVVIAQIDPRYNNTVLTLKSGQTIAIKGILTDYSIDTDLGLGNSLQLNYCTLSN